MAVSMNPVLSSVQSLMQMFAGKAQAFVSEIDTIHMVWLEEIQQEANRMFTRDFNAEPELMPKTPSQKRNTRRKRVSLGRQEESQARRRFSKGRRSNLRGSSSNALNSVAEEENASQGSTSKTESTRPKRATRKKQTKADEEEANQTLPSSTKTEEVVTMKAEILETVEDEGGEQKDAEEPSSTTESPKNISSTKVVVAISPEDRLSAELAVKVETSPGHEAAKMEFAEPAQSNKSRQSSVRHSLKLRRSVAGLRHSLTQESVRRASRRSMLKRKAARMDNSTSGSNTGDDTCMDSVDEESEAMVASEPTEPAADTVQSEESTEEMTCANETVTPPLQLVGRITRSVAANSPKLAPQPLFVVKIGTPDKRTVTADKQQTPSAQRLSNKRKAPDVGESPTKRASPPKKSQSTIRPNMKAFLHTVQKNQMLMMTPNSLGRSTVLKSFIKHTTPLKIDQRTSSGIVTKERHKLEALKKKQEQEIERMKKMEEEKKRKQEEQKKKRDERLKRVFDAKVKEEQREVEKKKRIEQKMAQIDEKNDKRQADEKRKKVIAMKRQEELELKKKQEEEAKKKLQQEEEKRLQEAKKKAEEEERAQKLAEAHRALELKREQERERERERQAAAERERLEREKTIAQQRELERAAREKERRELEEKRKALEEKRKLEQQLRLAAEEKAAKAREAAKKQAAPALNVTVDIEKSVLSTPVGKGGGALNQTVDIDRSVMSTPSGKGAGGNGLNVTVDIEKSPQSYSITPKGGNKIPSKNPEDYGMDQNSDDSTDDESAPRKPIPSWAEGHNLQLLIKKQYFNPPDLDAFFGKIEPPNLENIFYKSKPRYFKRTSSAVWHSPPGVGK